MNVLVMYEASNVVSGAFRAAGHNAMSLDIVESDGPDRYHILEDAEEYMSRIESGHCLTDWDMIIAHPMCTYVTASAAWAYKDPDFDKYPESGYHMRIGPDVVTGVARRDLRDKALLNMQRILNLPVKYICMENPGTGFFNKVEKPSQIIHPHQFGHNASKATGLWLRNLPPLEPTENVPPEYYHEGKPRWANQAPSGAQKLPPSKDRWRIRSKTYQGIADAMVQQWGDL